MAETPIEETPRVTVADVKAHYKAKGRLIKARYCDYAIPPFKGKGGKNWWPRMLNHMEQVHPVEAEAQQERLLDMMFGEEGPTTNEGGDVEPRQIA
jgi:hypothetical protein